jgi:hypothetical protein
MEDFSKQYEYDMIRYRDRTIILQEYMTQLRNRYTTIEDQLIDTSSKYEQLMTEHVELRSQMSLVTSLQSSKEKEIVELKEQLQFFKSGASAMEKLEYTRESNSSTQLPSSFSFIEQENENTVKEFTKQLKITQKLLKESAVRENYDQILREQEGQSRSNSKDAATAYMIAGDLRDQRRLLQEQTTLLRTLTNVLDGVAERLDSVPSLSHEYSYYTQPTAMASTTSVHTSHRTPIEYDEFGNRRERRRLLSRLPGLRMFGSLKRRLFDPLSNVESVDEAELNRSELDLFLRATSDDPSPL